MTPFVTRGHVALSGTFGYELDITKLTDEEKAIVKAQTAEYHKYNDLIREGDYYRMESYTENKDRDSWMIVSKEKDRALVFCVQVLSGANRKSRFLRLKGLDPDRRYVADGREYQGSTLMRAGLRIPAESGDFKSRLIEIRQV